MFNGVQEVRRTHPYGAAVEVKDPIFYTDPTTKLYLTSDNTAGEGRRKTATVNVTYRFEPGSVVEHDTSVRWRTPPRA